jgi:hypothetical protein
MTNTQKSAIACTLAMLAAGFVNSVMAQSALADSRWSKAAVVGLVAAAAFVVIRKMLPAPPTPPPVSRGTTENH